MPKNKVSDPITDQEIAFARLVLSGGMTDRRAAEAVGLNPDSAAYTKAKPRVRAYMLEHRAAVQQKLAQQEAEGQHRFHLDREQVLARLWEIANLGPETTRGSITGQVKALAMIVAMQNFIPDPLPASSEKTSPPRRAKIYEAAWLRDKSQSSSVPAQHEDAQGVSDREPDTGPLEEHREEHSPNPQPSPSTFTNRFTPSQAHPPAPQVPARDSVPDTRVSFSIKKGPFARR